MKKNHCVGLRNELAGYSSSAKSRTTLATLTQRLGNWSAYAAATGSVMALATSASADIIPYTGTLPQTVEAPPVGQGVASNTRPVSFAPDQSFPFRIVTSNMDRSAFASAGAGLEVLHKSVNGLVKNLSSGQVISSKGIFGTDRLSLRYLNANGPAGEWVPGVPGFEGFRLATPNGNFDYGWAELEVGVDGNGLPDSLTLLALAYSDTPNAPIGAGQTTQPADVSPEPATAGLMLLALGAAGVTVLRSRRRSRKERQAAQA